MPLQLEFGWNDYTSLLQMQRTSLIKKTNHGTSRKHGSYKIETLREIAFVETILPYN